MAKQSGSVIFALSFLVLLIFVPIFALYSSVDKYEVKIEHKERVNKSEDSYYLVFTEDEKVFKNDDNLFLWKFNSSDVHAQLHLDSTYLITTYGWRVPFFSMYENITEVKPIPKVDSTETIY